MARTKKKTKRKLARPKLPMQRQLNLRHEGRYFDLRQLFDRVNEKHFRGRLRGYMRAGIDDPQTIDADHDLYGDGSIRLLATPGHTVGHQSVLVTPTVAVLPILASEISLTS